MIQFNENTEQELLFDWAHGPWDNHKKERRRELAPCIQEGYPEAQLLFAIPNGAWMKDRRQAVLMKRRGLVSGVSDVMLPVTVYTKGWHLPGLFLELKVDGGSISKEQSEFIQAVINQGYAANVVWGSKSAIKAIKVYIDFKHGSEREKAVQREIAV